MSSLGSVGTAVGIALSAPSVTVGPITVQEQDTALFDETAPLTPHYQIRGKYYQDRGIYMNGVTSPNGFNGISAAFFQLYAPTLLWIVDWTGCAAGEDPLIPDPNVTDSNWVLLDVMPQTVMVVLLADGQTPLYRISGRYVYGCKNPNANVYNNVQFGRAPWVLDSATTRTVQLSKLTQGLINVVGKPTAGPNQNTPALVTGIIAPGTP